MSKKHIYVNLKRFDIPKEYGGVNTINPIEVWGEHIVQKVKEGLEGYASEDYEFAIYFPEAHLIPAVKANGEASHLFIGCQSVYREDVETGKNFGALTSNRSAKAMKAMGVESTIIGHCEERNDKKGILSLAGLTDMSSVNILLNQEINAAQNAGLRVLYCIGETSAEKQSWKEVLKEQLEVGLEGVNKDEIVIAYEPVWAIGPGKTPPGREVIAEISAYIKEVSGNLQVVYGGGLKADNAKMLATIPTIDGGLIALTRFAGDIGFYPEEFLEILSLYASNEKGR